MHQRKSHSSGSDREGTKVIHVGQSTSRGHSFPYNLFLECSSSKIITGTGGPVLQIGSVTLHVVVTVGSSSGGADVLAALLLKGSSARVKHDIPVLSIGGAAKIKLTPLSGHGQQTVPDGQQHASTSSALPAQRQRGLQSLSCGPNQYKTSREQSAHDVLSIKCS